MGIATGAALSVKMRKTDQVVLCFFGDGALNLGIFHECLNMAAVWKLPVVYMCENNLYGMSVSVKRACAVQDLTKRALAYDMPSQAVDGMDVLAVKEATSRWVDYARGDKGPSLLICNTYRYYGHSRSDPRKYRTKEEEQQWRDRDPIKTFSQRCVKEGILSQTEVETLEKEVEAEIEQAVQFAIDSPWPQPEELCEDVYA